MFRVFGLTYLSFILHRTPADCIDDLECVLNRLNEGVSRKYSEVELEKANDLAAIFDCSIMFSYLQRFSADKNGNIKPDSKEDRIAWETQATEEFQMFWNVICQLPQVVKAQALDDSHMYFPHNGILMLRKWKEICFNLIWKNKYGKVSQLYLSRDGDYLEIDHRSCLLSLKEVHCLEGFHLDPIYHARFSYSDETHLVRFNEEYFYTLFFTESQFHEDVGKELCLVLDVALGASGCEAVVEGFYSLMKAHKKAGGQSNDVLMSRSIVDWALPHPISCPEAVKEITMLFLNGDGGELKKHRTSKFFGNGRRKSHNISKVVDRLEDQQKRFPFLE